MKSHLAFSVKRQAPPPPMLLAAAQAPKPALGIDIKKKKKKKKIQPQADTSALATAAVGVSAVDKLKGLLGKKRKRPEEEEGSPLVAAPSSTAKQRVRAPVAAGAATSPSSFTAAAPSVSPSTIGADAGLVLLVTGLPPETTELDLQRHFAAGAPLQVKLLSDWSDKSKLRRAASLAVASAAAAKRALSPAMAQLQAAGGSGGGGTSSSLQPLGEPSVGGTVRLRVCDAARSGGDDGEVGFGGSMSSGMRSQFSVLEAKALASVGGGARLASPDAADLRHLLLCCDVETAKAAVDEISALMRSGAPKRPVALLMSTVLRHRRLSGGDIWLGRVHGKPLPRAEAQRLRTLLDALDWSSMPADGKLRGAMAVNSFKLGMLTKPWGKQNGPYTPFAFAPGMGVWDAASVTRKHKELWEAASALIRAIDPSYPFTGVGFNRNFSNGAVGRHRDDKDAMHQIATAFGEYLGGELRVRGQDGTIDCNTKDRYVRFDGRFEHEVLPYEGTRYSVVFFALAPPFAVDASSTEEGVGCQ
jgi:hypothetical protein